ncbi:GGDEF domain-containing protein [Curvibacter sp. APW13]|uniref:GGDEF domain-containing protein n=1 Tax=Curvibacter sp. APW13 TaxID=3077236 RepID=UPI0028DE12A8|nr:GGDEF domain-containing protein [Curvibacter sp. APW13]MDT8991197.1 GGDEF domain-containing protein [Curvibacter sp. APW13]
MNFSLASLAVELLLFSAAWLAVGLSIREHKRACLNWAWGWLLIGIAALLMFGRQLWAPFSMELPINFLLLTAFLQIQQGLAHLERKAIRPAFLVATYSGLVLIEVVRWLEPGHPDWLAWIFACTLAVPVSGIVRLLWSNAPEWFQRQRITQVLLVFPVVLTVVVLLVRAFMMSQSRNAAHFDFEGTTTFIIVATTAFQVSLGFFNFSLFALVLGSLIKRLDNLVSQDQITGLSNRSVMLERLKAEHARFLRGGRPYALVLMDLDQFKQVNNRYGHTAGDKTLRAIGQRLRATVRDSDVIARFGGDDFMLLLPDTELADACKQAERIRAAIADEPLVSSRCTVSLTMSVGLTVVRHVDVDTAPCLSRVDTALRQAQNQGRNCLRVA